VDAVVLEADTGLVIPLANYTLEALDKTDFTLRVSRPVKSIESVHLGELPISEEEGGTVSFSLPLDASDYVKVYYQ